VLGLALFAAGFATQYLLDDDLEAIESRLTALDQRTSQIQDTLGSATGGAGDGAGAAAAASPAAATSAAADDDPSWGPDDASVVIVEFADFQCPFCARHNQQTLPGIKEAYGDKVQYVYRDFPLTSIHQFAQKAAEAGQCAQDQGLFWQYHDLLFDNQGALAVSDLKGYAEQLGADSGEFNDCLDSGKHQDEVLKDLQDGRTAGVTGTPAFVINGVLVSGAQPFAAFQTVIDQALVAAE
jgi:protein-disulfide isomerase